MINLLMVVLGDKENDSGQTIADVEKFVLGLQTTEN